MASVTDTPKNIQALGPQSHNLQAVDEVEFQGLKFIFHGDRFVFLVSVLRLSEA